MICIYLRGIGTHLPQQLQMRITFEPQGVIGHAFEGMFLRSFEIICAGQSCFKTHLKACLMGLNLIPVEVENTKYLRNHSIDLPKILSMGWHDVVESSGGKVVS